MSDKQVKVIISTDASGGVTGFKLFNDGMKKTESLSASLSSKIKENWLSISAGIAAAAVTANQAWGMIKAGAEFDEQKGILDNLARKYSSTSDSLVQSMAAASEGMIANADLMQVALGGISKGLKPEQLIDLADAAKMLGDSVGKSATTALVELAESLESGRAKALKGYAGATLDLKDAFGELESKMTAAEKVQAMYGLIMIHNIKLQKEQTKAVDDARDKVDKMEASWKNMTTTMSVKLKNATVTLDDFLGKYLVYPAEELLFGTKRGTTGPNVYEVPPIGEDSDTKLKKYYEDREKLRKVLEKRAANEKSGKEYESLSQSWVDVARDLNATIAGQGLTDIEKKMISNQKEAEKLAEKYGKLPGALELIKQARSVEDIEAITAAEKSGAASYERLVREEVESFDKAAKDKLEAERDLYTDLRGYEDSFYQASLALIDSQIEKYREMKVDEVAITAWAEEEKRKARLKYDRETGTQDMGFYQGLSDWRKSLQTDFEFGEDLAKTTATSMQSTFSNVFFDAFKGDLKDFRTYWDSFCDAILRKFSDRVADMVAKWAMGLAEMKWEEASSGLSGMISSASSLLSSLYGGSSGSGLGAAGGTAADAIASGAIVLHGGGVVGIDSAPMRYVPASAFAGAPRYHKGFMSDEMPAILKRGESVLTPAQMKAVGNQSSGGPTNVTIMALDSKSFEEFARRNASIFQNVTTQGLRDNKTRSEWKSLLKG